ncbi:MAG: TauD/TfdA family dioxygenase [Planctomycetota bacterium]|jgi:alpha-ketoglutarate-dependent taurine dioxygenase
MMTELPPVAPLTPSGAGILVSAESLPPAPDRVPALAELLREHGFVVLRGAADSLGEAVDLMRRFGPINEAKTRTEGAVIVEDQGQGEVFRSSNALPLHKDGGLTGYDVRIIGIYCVAFREVVGGRTYISDADRAMRSFPAEDQALLQRHGCQAMALDDTGYYRSDFTERWHPLPAFRELPDGRRTLRIGLPHEPGEPESWRIRIQDVTPEVSDRILADLRTCLLDDGFTYHHEWQEGDLLLLDNDSVMHGREAFTAERRALANIQVLAE